MFIGKRTSLRVLGFTVALSFFLNAAGPTLALDEEKIGNDYHKELCKKYKVYETPRVTEAGRKVCDVAGISNVKFYAIDMGKDDSPNAFQIPGHIYATKSLLKELDDISLIFILGHELGHESGHHLAKQTKKNQSLGIFAAILEVATGVKANSVGDIVINIAGGAILNKYSRTQESEADVFGLQVIHDLGIPFSKAAESFRKIGGGRSENRTLNSLFGSHPMMKDRISRADTADKWLMMRATDIYRSASKNIAVIWPFYGENPFPAALSKQRTALVPEMARLGFDASVPNKSLPIWTKLSRLEALAPEPTAELGKVLNAEMLVDISAINKKDEWQVCVFDVKNARRMQLQWKSPNPTKLASLIKDAVRAPSSEFKPY